MDNRDWTVQENMAQQWKIMKYELRKAKGELQEKNGNIKKMKILLKAAQSRLATARKNRVRHGGQD